MNSLIKKISSITVLLLIIGIMAACSSENVIDPQDEPTTDQLAMLKITEDDETLSSFEPNYNEDDAMGFFGKTNVPIFPIKVGQRMALVSKNLDVVFQGDSAFGTLTKTFNGILFIAASYDSITPGGSNVDTLIKKPFSTTVTRKLIFRKVNNTNNPNKNWRLIAISLPEGGTPNANVEIKKLSIFLPGGIRFKLLLPTTIT